MKRPELRKELDFFCGCGCPEDAADTLLTILELHPLYAHQEEFREIVPGTGLQYLFLYLLDERGWTEHGGGIGGQWLTEKGEAVRDALRREKQISEDFEELFPEDPPCIHGIASNDPEYAEHDCMAVWAEEDKKSRPPQGEGET